MDIWLENVIRQLILYSLPVLVSLTTIGMLESRMSGKPTPQPFHAIGWMGTWIPWLASLFFGRGVIIALPQPIESGCRAARLRCICHLLLCLISFFLYSFSLDHQSPTGLPPLHHWWAKVLMFFNLCMAAIHLLPLPGQWIGELLLGSKWVRDDHAATIRQHPALIHGLFAATPLLDWSIGAIVIFPTYEKLATLA